MQFKAPRGTNDFLPERTVLLQKVEEEFRKASALYGYEEIRTPTFEQAELFARGLGEASDLVTKEMYVFQDRKGRTFALRPEITAGVVRAYVEHKLFKKGTLHKFFYIASIYRYERPQAGRYREAHQVGIEAIGSLDPWLDVEVIDLNLHYLEALGLKDARLVVNSIGCPVCRPGYRQALRDALAKVLDELCADCQVRYQTNPLRILDCKVERCQELSRDTPGALDYLCRECSEHFSAVKEGLKQARREFTIDPRLVRGLDYYTKTAFEIVSDRLGAQCQISGGGRYDGLVEEVGGPPTPGIGFAAGIERIALLLEGQGEAEKPARVVFVVAVEPAQRKVALRIVRELRLAGIAADTDYSGRPLRGQMRAASGFRYAVIIGPEELRGGTVQLKDMATGQQVSVEQAQLAATLRRRL